MTQHCISARTATTGTHANSCGFAAAAQSAKKQRRVADNDSATGTGSVRIATAARLNIILWPVSRERAAPSSAEHPPQMRSKPAKPAGTAPSTFNRKARRDWTAKKRALSQNDNPENEPEALACPRRRHQTAPRGSLWTVPW